MQTSILNLFDYFTYCLLSFIINYYFCRIVVNYGILVKMKADNWWYFISPFQRDVWLVLIFTVLFAGTKFLTPKDKIINCRKYLYFPTETLSFTHLTIDWYHRINLKVGFQQCNASVIKFLFFIS